LTSQVWLVRLLSLTHSSFWSVSAEVCGGPKLCGKDFPVAIPEEIVVLKNRIAEDESHSEAAKVNGDRETKQLVTSLPVGSRLLILIPGSRQDLEIN
jgi:hypothetical protein